MTARTRTVLRTIIAALVISSAAICATGQTDSQRKENVRQVPADPVSPVKEKSPANVTDQRSGPVSDQASVSTGKNSLTSTQYSYEFTQPAFLVSHILIEHDLNGSGNITFERRNSDPISDPLDLSATTIERLRLLWDTLHFLDSDVSYQTPRQYPHLGNQRLQMKQDTRERVAEFNWTSDKDAFALVSEYKRIANQAIFIFDITLARENQPLDAPKLMDQFDAYLRRGEIADAQQLIPLFRDLSTDERIPLMARNSAARIVKKIEK